VSQASAVCGLLGRPRWILAPDLSVLADLEAIPEVKIFNVLTQAVVVSRVLVDEFVRVATSDGHPELRWSAFREVVENDRLFLLYLGRRRFWPIPKRYLGPEGMQRLRTLASPHPEVPSAC